LLAKKTFRKTSRELGIGPQLVFTQPLNLKVVLYTPVCARSISDPYLSTAPVDQNCRALVASVHYAVAIRYLAPARYAALARSAVADHCAVEAHCAELRFARVVLNAPVVRFAAP